MSSLRASLGVLILVLLLAFIATFMDFPAQTISKIGDSLVIQDALQPVDVIHVIAGEDYRTLYALQLYQQGYAKMLFFTGGWCNQHGYYHGAHALQLAMDAGVPREAIAYDDSQVHSTYDEALLLQKYLAENRPDYRTIIVVSDPFHMRRVRWSYRRVMGQGFTTLMAPVPFDQTPYKQQWWSDQRSINYVKDEYGKLIYYFFRYQLHIKWLSAFDKY